MDYTSVSLRLHAPCSDRNEMNCILWPYSGFFSSSVILYQCKFIDFLFLLRLRDKAVSECGIVFCLWTTLQSFHLLRFLKGTFSAYLRVKWLPARTWISKNFHAFANDISDLVELVLCIEQNRICPRFTWCTTNSGHQRIQRWRNRLPLRVSLRSLDNSWCVTASTPHTKQNKSPTLRMWVVHISCQGGHW